MTAQLIINGISLGAVYALIAVGFAIIFNILKFSNFAHGGFMTVTAYVGFLATRFWHTSLLWTLLIASLAGGMLGIIAELVAFRRIRNNKGPVIYYFVSSITLGMLLENLMTIFFSTNFYAYPNFFPVATVKVGQLLLGVPELIMFCISSLALIILAVLIYRTKLGTALRSVSYDVDTSGLMGINVLRIIQLAFFLAGFLGGISGVFLGISYTLYPQLGQLVVKGFVASVIGGLGSLSGAVIGAFLLGIIEILLIRLVGSGISPVFIFVIMLLFLLVRPRGIAGSHIQEKA
ncbi:branched-chain amino acid ABC transporter permease [Moorella sp. E308F]|jgi:branched-chain amino acid transport system permease protein|uniref:branched-chain amino acid ABC transporter permease n=1 Tax=unclassified Neomoorella TaxID=2676739 RepID=UPI0010FFB718|nr:MULTISPECIES: branched-chain amino acid ABC transporter permease [unclassified Moorella (in: firmicutes)]GEA16027.1 branched-chain amino acid ABC transporter permease [Moorella sp. E308F]GEA19130.1 branched-chain amino acid ABC transporter permease [Moorella sp. E306M]